MFSSLIPEVIPEAPVFDCFLLLLRSNSLPELLENKDSISMSGSATDVAVDKRALILELGLNLNDLGLILMGFKLMGSDGF